MARYTAQEQSAYESSGVQGFRLEKDGDRARVVFLYAGPESIDGWACHRFQIGTKGYTVTMDCPRTSADPIEKCPACKAGEQLYTRLFVRLYNLNTNKVEIWDRASGFRTELVAKMAYFNPLYSKVFEITRQGSGLQTKYNFQSLNDSNFTQEQYEEYVKQAEEVADSYVKPIDSYQSLLQRSQASKEQAAQEAVQVNPTQAANNAWAPPAQGTPMWGQAPAQNQSWGQAPAQAPAQVTPPQATPGWGQAPAGWGQAPAQNQTAPQGQPTAQTPPQGQAPAGWGQPPAGWGQMPQGTGNGNQ